MQPRGDRTTEFQSKRDQREAAEAAEVQAEMERHRFTTLQDFWLYVRDHFDDEIGDKIIMKRLKVRIGRKLVRCEILPHAGQKRSGCAPSFTYLCGDDAICEGCGEYLVQIDGDWFPLSWPDRDVRRWQARKRETEEQEEESRSRWQAAMMAGDCPTVDGDDDDDDFEDEDEDPA